MMKKSLLIAIAAFGVASAAVTGCSGTKADKAEDPVFITVKDGNFYRGDSVYRFVGTNFWYGGILGSTGEGGDRERLNRELDLMQEHGIDNLRVLVGGDGAVGDSMHIRPVLQPTPGVYNDTLLDGLDYLMAELEKRNMYAVLYLNNSWEWSGGMGTYLDWAGVPIPAEPTKESWPDYCKRLENFYTNDSAKAMAARHVDYIVGRTNRYTGKPYSESPALMAWEIANEPRPFSNDSLAKEAYLDWVLSTARQIKAIDPNHLVATGDEGYIGTAVDLNLWKRMHEAPEIDYDIIHLWPFNWGWIDRNKLSEITDSVVPAINKSKEYIKEHVGLTGKPLVLEEFGYPRDNNKYSPDSPITGRDIFYQGILDFVTDSTLVQGVNIWGWAGEAVPQHEWWHPGDPYMCDPAQEQQGLYSVFASDSTTMDIIKKAAAKINK